MVRKKLSEMVDVSLGLVMKLFNVHMHLTHHPAVIKTWFAGQFLIDRKCSDQKCHV